MKKVTVNDFVMTYYELGAQHDEVIIFLHGITDSSSSWASTAPLLADKYHIYALDQRGHGDSESPAWGYTMFQFGEDVISFMDTKKIKKAVIIGHSMGSAVAHQVASKYPGRVSGLILIAGSPSSVNNVVLTDVFENIVGKDDFKDPIGMDFIKEWQDNPNPVEQDFLEKQLGQTAKVESRVWKAAFWGLITDDHRAFLSRISAPTLILWGDEDAIYPKSDQDGLVKFIPNAKLKVYPGAGHNIQWERGRNKQVADDIRAFLNK
ncbi:MAG: alpha/beta hydrolase [Desulfobacteraceae bacterium]|nr:alpha/beta hydrolase [Desulfobacteraceae bacterium]